MPSITRELTSSWIFCSIASTEVWNGRSVTMILVAAVRIVDLGDRPQLDRPAAGPVRVENALAPEDLRTRREIRALSRTA